MKVFFKKSIGPYKKGKTKNVPEKLARFYIKNNIAEKVVKEQTYNTKVMRAAEPVESQEVKEVDEYEGLGVDELRALAELRGVKVHHNAGATKIKEALKSAEESI